MGPGGSGLPGALGNWSLELELIEDSPASARAAIAMKRERVRTPVPGFLRLLFLCLDIDLHLIVGVVEIAAGVPHGGFGLHSSLVVGGAGEDYVVAVFGGLPVVVPETPRIFGLVSA